MFIDIPFVIRPGHWLAARPDAVSVPGPFLKLHPSVSRGFLPGRDERTRWWCGGLEETEMAKSFADGLWEMLVSVAGNAATASSSSGKRWFVPFGRPS